MFSASVIELQSAPPWKSTPNLRWSRSRSASPASQKLWPS